jgi:hypothetical protein
VPLSISIHISLVLFKSNMKLLEICRIFFKLRKFMKPHQFFEFKWVLENKNVKPNNFLYVYLNNV